MIPRLLDRFRRPKRAPLDLVPGKYEGLAPFGERDGFFVGHDKVLLGHRLFQVVPATDHESSQRLMLGCRRLVKVEPTHVPQFVDLGITPEGAWYSVAEFAEGTSSLLKNAWR